MADQIGTLKTLHTNLIDNRHGYEEALEEAEGKGLTPLFRQLIALHSRDADEIAGLLAELGHPVDDSGSFLSTVHRTIMDIRSLFGGLDESVLPGLIDGEERTLKHYDAAIDATDQASRERAALARQRAALVATIGEMKVLRAAAA